jgi:hypothetical protein
MAYNGEEIIYTGFNNVTRYLPSHPGGCVEIGAIALGLHNAGQIQWQDALALPLQEDNLTASIVATEEAHRLAHVPDLETLGVSLPFAFELVRADLASSFPATEPLEEIERVTPELLKRTGDFMATPEIRAFSLRALRVASNVLRSRSASRHIAGYRNGIVDVAQRYEGSTDFDAKREEMDALRQGVTDKIRPLMIGSFIELQEDAPRYKEEQLDMEVIAHNLTRWKPSDDLINHHFKKQAI